MSSPNFHAGYLAVAPASPHLSGQREGPEDSPTRPWGHTARVCVCGGVCVENAAPTLASCTEIKIKKRSGGAGDARLPCGQALSANLPRLSGPHRPLRGYLSRPLLTNSARSPAGRAHGGNPPLRGRGGGGDTHTTGQRPSRARFPGQPRRSHPGTAFSLVRGPETA